MGIGNSIHRETILEFSFANILDINTFNGHYIEKSSVDHLQKACRHGSEKLASGRSRESHWIVLPRKKKQMRISSVIDVIDVIAIQKAIV